MEILIYVFLFQNMGWRKEFRIMSKKYVFVTGGVVSGLGKGITAASLRKITKK